MIISCRRAIQRAFPRHPGRGGAVGRCQACPPRKPLAADRGRRADFRCTCRCGTRYTIPSFGVVAGERPPHSFAAVRAADSGPGVYARPVPDTVGAPTGAESTVTKGPAHRRREPRGSA